MIDTKFLKERLEARFYPHKVEIYLSPIIQWVWVCFKSDKVDKVDFVGKTSSYSKIEKALIDSCDKLDEVD
jgi:hypothetical protein